MDKERTKESLLDYIGVLKTLNEKIGVAIEEANTQKDWDEIYDILDFLRGIVDDNWMFTREN